MRLLGCAEACKATEGLPACAPGLNAVSTCPIIENEVQERRQTILLLSVSAGAGHVRAAQAIQSAADRWYPDVETVHVDIMDLVPVVFRKVYVDSYLALVERYPGLWGYIYDKTDHEQFDSTFNRLRQTIERLSTRKLKQVLDEIRPDQVICTHFLPAQLMSREAAKGTYSGSVWVQVTDFDIHSLWLHEHISGYFVASDEIAWRMAQRGIPLDRIHATGIPIMPVFGEKYDRGVCAAEFGLAPARPILLMMSGSTGIGPCDALARCLLNLEDDFQLVVLAGKNRKMLESLQTLAKSHPGRLFPMGYTTVIERLMAAGDVAITKPGGLTSAECLAMKLPMILTSPIPGQEERNANFLLENGAAMKAMDAAALAWRVHQLLSDREGRAAMLEQAMRLARPVSARSVLDIVLDRKRRG